ncbi:unnamed protein product [Cylicocyclus nassatus]|uniref:Endoplasmic reticulum junction formation protein lunapark n=1 Tax=Cylicocyclus nassatus TaxID=53992 RepID=A0AA36HFX6_CYLNA|nr:unnamed protein product [Cylicocyclus nassatus]
MKKISIAVWENTFEVILAALEGKNYPIILLLLEAFTEMGNILRRKKKEVTEELESLSQQMKIFRDDIEKTAEAKRMILWYLTLSTFFLSSSFIGYACVTIKRKEHQVLFSILAFVAGLVVLWLGRKAANAFYNWRIHRKRQGLDGLVARKRSILETVKETETFKVAKEILDKYDQESPKSLSQPPSPATEKRMAETRGQRADQIQAQMNASPLKEPNRPPERNSRTKSVENIPVSEIGPRPLPLPPRPRLKPIRPFQREGTTVVDKMVDYFFGDGPSQRLALICSNCHGHNGMALPAEYDYLAFVCFICGHFNPAKKFRPSHHALTPAPTPPKSMKSNASNPRSSSSSPVQPSNNKEAEEKDRKEHPLDDMQEEQELLKPLSH